MVVETFAHFRLREAPVDNDGFSVRSFIPRLRLNLQIVDVSDSAVAKALTGILLVTLLMTQKNCWSWTEDHGVRGVFPPRKGAKLKVHGNTNQQPLQRDEHIRLQLRLGKKGWKKKTKYSRRSIAETAMYHFKIILGDELSSREPENQIAEAILKCKILNMMPTPNAL